MTEDGKLVRDRIPEIIAAHGGRCEITHVEPARRQLRLTDKLAEECAEFRESGDIEELVDVVEVVHAILAESGLPWEVFETMRLAKREARGGFDDGVILVSTSRR